MKVEEGVHCKRFDGYCTKQWVKISKATWTSANMGKRSTYWTFSNETSLMKNDVNDEVFNGASKILIIFNGVVNQDGVLKLCDKLKGDYATHFWGWIKRPIAQSSNWKCF